MYSALALEENILRFELFLGIFVILASTTLSILQIGFIELYPSLVVRLQMMIAMAGTLGYQRFRIG